MKYYIAGQITDNPNYKQEFAEAAALLEAEGHTVMNPAILPVGFEHGEYLHINRAMIDVCQGTAFLKSWKNSKGAHFEYGYSIGTDKQIRFL